LRTPVVKRRAYVPKKLEEGDTETGAITQQKLDTTMGLQNRTKERENGNESWGAADDRSSGSINTQGKGGKWQEGASVWGSTGLKGKNTAISGMPYGLESFWVGGETSDVQFVAYSTGFREETPKAA